MERKRSWPAATGGRRTGQHRMSFTKALPRWAGEARLTRIPYLQPDDRVGVGVDDAFGQEARADRGRDLGRAERAFAVARHQGRLPDALGADHDDLGLERRHGGPRESSGRVLPCCAWSRFSGDPCPPMPGGSMTPEYRTGLALCGGSAKGQQEDPGRSRRLKRASEDKTQVGACRRVRAAGDAHCRCPVYRCAAEIGCRGGVTTRALVKSVILAPPDAWEVLTWAVGTGAAFPSRLPPAFTSFRYLFVGWIPAQRSDDDQARCTTETT